MDQNNWIYLVLILLVLGFGAGVVVAGRRRSGPSGSAHDEQVAVTDSEKQVTISSTAVESATHVGDSALDVVGGESAIEAGEPRTADEVAQVAETQTAEPEAPRSMRDRLARARGAFSDAIGSVLGRSAIDDGVWEELEDALLIADVGIGIATSLLDPLRERVSKGEIEDPEALISALRASMVAQLDGANRDLAMRDDAGTSIWLFVGVNGVGKTTTIGKLASRQIAAGSTVLLSAGDTFRAAAAEQLAMWAEPTHQASSLMPLSVRQRKVLILCSPILRDGCTINRT
jgi:fused signal recognition particle receptor